MKTDLAPPQTAAHEWAGQVLDIEWPTEQTQKTHQLSALLGVITQSDYVLSIDQANASQIITDSARTIHRSQLASEAISAWRHEQGVQAIAEFKAAFFELPCDERTHRWDLLSREYGDQRDLNSQLIQLKRGLQVSIPSGPMTSRQQYILRTCRNVFLGSPPIAAHLRRVFCNQWRCDETWEDAVDEALEKYGDVLQGIAPWVDEFGDQRFWESQKGKPSPILRELIETATSDEEGSSYNPFSERFQFRAEPPVIQPPAPGVWAATIWIGVTVLMIIITIVLLLIEGAAVVPVDTHPVQHFPPRPYTRLR